MYLTTTMKKRVLHFDAVLFGKDVALQRVIESLSLRQLAHRLHGNVSVSTLSRIEKGGKPDVETFIILLAYMNNYEVARYMRAEFIDVTPATELLR